MKVFNFLLLFYNGNTATHTLLLGVSAYMHICGAISFDLWESAVYTSEGLGYRGFPP